jgi:hypothetical protein
VISEREEHSSCIGQNLRPSLTLLTFPIWTHSSLVYIAGSFGNPEIVKVVSDQEVFDCPDLYSTQEEEDTRMIPQALHADKRLKELGKQGGIIIKTSDTDVNFLPFQKKEEIVLHPERACAPGRTLHVISEREEHSS